ncbi:MAG: toxin [Sulfuricurvum sp.]|nr:toxin [Sulfuricurvum sp.]
MNYQWNEEKNALLKAQRGIGFEDIVTAVMEGAIVDIIRHPNTEKYPDQMIYIVEVLEYIYMVPYVRNDQEIFFKTIIPSRKMKKIYKDEV